MSFRLHPAAAIPLAFAAALAATPASARNIVIANDDGLTSNTKALYDALKAEGHDVIVALPCSQQSGMGGAVMLMKPLGPLAADCVNGAARAGDPGAGPMTRPGLGGDFFYVDGTPVMAMLYGIDVVAAERWGKAPDLVLSGPNVGQNAGYIVVSSGTVSNVQHALARGIPAIALSAGANTADTADLANPLSATVAKRSLELLDFLEGHARGGALLPAGVALNVNFPDQPDGAGWKIARIGNFSRYDVKFVTDLPATLGKAKPGDAPRPGLFARVSDRPAPAGSQGDEAEVAKTDIAVSVMQLAYDADPALARPTKRLLRGFMKR